MTHRLLALAAGLLLAAATTAPAGAQTSSTSGAVRGTVVGPGDAPVADASVLLRDVERGVTRQVRTDGEGRFTLGLLLPGTYLYAVRSRAPDLKAGAAGPVRVRAGQRSSVRVALEPDRYVYTETGEELGLSVDEAGVMELVDPAELEGLPTEGRDWKALFLLSGLVSLAEDGSFRLSGGPPLPTRVDGQEQ